MIRDIALLDDATRPVAPTLAGVSGAQRHHGRQLAMIHQLHLQQLAEVRVAMEMAAAGTASAAQLQDRIATLDMIANYRRFGTLCGRECRALTYHHQSEDQLIFPVARQAGAGFGPVIDRLIAEHGVIHELIVALAECAQGLLSDPTPARYGDLKQVFETLETVVRSHFRYEEGALEEAIGVTDAPF